MGTTGSRNADVTDVPLETASSAQQETPTRPNTLKGPNQSRNENAAIKIPDANQDHLDLPFDPRSPTIDVARTPLVDAAPFVDPRSPANNILRTPVEKTNGFKAFALDESLPYIDESQEVGGPGRTRMQPARLSLSVADDDDEISLEGSDGLQDLSPGPGSTSELSEPIEDSASHLEQINMGKTEGALNNNAGSSISMTAGGLNHYIGSSNDMTLTGMFLDYGVSGSKNINSSIGLKTEELLDHMCHNEL